MAMIHTFKAVGQPMLLDVGSGAVHAIDDMATCWKCGMTTRRKRFGMR